MVVLYYWLTVLTSSGVLLASNLDASLRDNQITLPNAKCMPRKTVVSVSDYARPSKVELFRCDGSSNDVTPALKICVQNQTEVIPVKVNSLETGSDKTVVMANHTSCKQICRYNGTQCNQYQDWDGNKCKCRCSYTHFDCPRPNFEWVPILCKCECQPRRCNQKKYFDIGECACRCKASFYDRCNERDGILTNDCVCIVSDKVNFMEKKCQHIYLKWKITCFVVLFITTALIIYNCIFSLQRKDGFFHRLCWSDQSELEIDDAENKML